MSELRAKGQVGSIETDRISAYDFVPNLTPGTFEITSQRLGWCRGCFTKLGPEGRKTIADDGRRG